MTKEARTRKTTCKGSRNQELDQGEVVGMEGLWV